MKTSYLLAVALASLLLVSKSEAQTASPAPSLPNNNETVPTTIVTKHSKLNPVMTYTGAVYSSTEILRMPGRDINSLANTVTGVNSIDRGIPNIRGAAASGTAYFVDGVRVYGALPH